MKIAGRRRRPRAGRLGALFPRNEGDAVKRKVTSTAIAPHSAKSGAPAGVSAHFQRFCLAAAIETLSEMMEQDAEAVCGARNARDDSRRAHRWGRANGKIGFCGGKIDIGRPRVRGFDGKERVLPSWESAVGENWLGEWTIKQMLIDVSTRKFARSVRPPGADVPASDGAGPSKSVSLRHFVALSAARMTEWMETRLDRLDLLVVQIDGVRIAEDRLAAAALGVDATGQKHPLGIVEGATENAATARALVDDLVDRGLDPAVRRLFVTDGSNALSTAIRRAFGRDAPIQRRQAHEARDILEGLPKSMRASARSVLRQAWELDDAANAAELLRNLARRLDLGGRRRFHPGRN